MPCGDGLRFGVVTTAPPSGLLRPLHGPHLVAGRAGFRPLTSSDCSAAPAPTRSAREPAEGGGVDKVLAGGVIAGAAHFVNLVAVRPGRLALRRGNTVRYVTRVGDLVWSGCPWWCGVGSSMVPEPSPGLASLV